MTSPAPRHYYLDWIKILCILLLVPYHAAMIFGPAHFGIKNDLIFSGYNIFNELIGMWYFSVLMFISGSAATFALRYRSAGQYLLSRFTRLLLPLVFGMLVVIPPQVYVERLQKHQIQPGYLAFYKHLADGIYPSGNLTWAQLWYVAYLFVISLLLLPVCLYIRNRAHFGERVFCYISHAPYLLIGWALPLMLVEYFLRAYFPFGNQNLVSDWANVLHLSIVFLYGFIIMRSPPLQAAVLRCRQPAFILAIAGVLSYYIPYILGYFSPHQQSADVIRLLDVWRGFNAWCWTLAIIGYASTYLTTINPTLQYASKAFLSVYILHQTILLSAAYFVVQWTLPAFFKFIILTIVTYTITLLIYHYLILPSKSIRMLFGG
ncbi:acyltransferase family protein [Chitinophaga sp.]|uniref:acyltransferase family protein n=1 Tax=Chitinophaga sp. TaxID=1869181 RepID=UPI0031DB27BD